MAVADIRSQLLVAQAITLQTISSNTDTVSPAVDTVDYDEGLMVGMWVSSYTDGTFTLVIQDSPDGSTDWQDLPAEKVIGEAVLTGDSAFAMSTIGCFSNRRYIRAVVRSTGVTTGADASVVYIAKGEYQPVHADSVS